MDRETELVYFNSNKGKKKLLHAGYVYVKNGSRGQTVYWKCEQKLECNGRLVVNDEVITKSKEHTHGPDRSSAVVQMTITNMKENMSDARECTSAVVNRHTERMDRQFRPYLPKEGAIKKRLQRTRRKDQPALPQSIEDINIEGKKLFCLI